MAKRRKSRKHRSAAQRAATARMLAARGGVIHKRRRRRGGRRMQHVGRRRGRRGGGFSMASIGVVPMLKNAAIGAGGALATDVAMGFVAQYLPPQFATPVDATGQQNMLYPLAKGALAIGLGIVGKRVLPGGMAAKMVEGSLTVTLYNAAKPLIPASVPLGYASPAQQLQPSNVVRLSEYVDGGDTPMQRDGMGEYVRRA